MLAYTARHYIFTFKVLNKKEPQGSLSVHEKFEPTVTVLIPAHNEEKVIERLLKRTTELTYPRSKMQVIVINDASTDDTGKIADQYNQILLSYTPFTEPKEKAAKEKL
jgi:cellulose synthase/poly-beta-1,6-N-acetylglucosamine synthase-like glycosyltransferase